MDIADEGLAQLIFDYLSKDLRYIEHVALNPNLKNVSIDGQFDLIDLASFIIDKIEDEIYQDSDYVTYVPSGFFDRLDKEPPEPTPAIIEALRRAKVRHEDVTTSD